MPLLSGHYSRCQVVFVRPLLLGHCHQAIVVRPLSSGHRHQAIVVRPLSSGHRYQAMFLVRTLSPGHCHQIVVIRPSSSGRCCQAIIVRTLDKLFKTSKVCPLLWYKSILGPHKKSDLSVRYAAPSRIITFMQITPGYAWPFSPIAR